MSFAWEVTIEDVMNVCKINGEKVTENKAEKILDLLNTDKIEKEALHGNDMDEQIDYANIEIWEQIVDKEIF